MVDFHLCSTSRSHSQASLCHYARKEAPFPFAQCKLRASLIQGSSKRLSCQKCFQNLWAVHCSFMLSLNIQQQKHEREVGPSTGQLFNFSPYKVVKMKTSDQSSFWFSETTKACPKPSMSPGCCQSFFFSSMGRLKNSFEFLSSYSPTRKSSHSGLPTATVWCLHDCFLIAKLVSERTWIFAVKII